MHTRTEGMKRITGFALTVALGVGLVRALETATAQTILAGPESKATTQPASPRPTDGPVIAVDETEHDFGEVWAGPEVKHAFKISNRGSATLQIRGVRVQCGCTTAGDHPRVLEPGQTIEIPFTLRTQGLKGRIAPKKIHIDSNDPVTPSLELGLVGTFKSRIELSPAFAAFGVVLTDQPVTKVIKIKNNTETPAEVKLRPAASEQLKFELTETEPGKAWDLTVTTVLPHKPGTFHAAALLDTSIEEDKLIRVSAAGRIPERLDLSPSIMPYSKPVRLPPGQDAGKVIFWLTNYGPSLVNVREATVDDPALTTQVEAVAPGKNYKIQVNIPQVATIPPAGRILTIHTDDPEKPTLQAKIVAYGGAARQTAAKPASTKPAQAASMTRPVHNLVGKPAPLFSLTTVEGSKLAVDDLQDKITVLNFISPTCPACKRQLPDLDKIRETYQARGVRFVNVVNPQPPRQKLFSNEEIGKILESASSRLEVAVDFEQPTGKAFHITGYPTVVVIGKDGKIESAIVGWKQVNLLSDQLQALLDGKPIPADKKQ